MKTGLIVSPHFDDAVLSTGQYMAGRTDLVVATVLGGTPAHKKVVTTYDQTCGFKNAEEAVSMRRQEDKAAMAVLNAKPVHLDHVDSQYGSEASFEAVQASLEGLLLEHEPEIVLGPLGIAHPDHVFVRNVLLELKPKNLVLYEELPSRVLWPETVDEAMVNLSEQGVEVKPYEHVAGPLATKMEAMWCYKSQLGVLNRYCIFVPERLWEVK